MAKRDTEDLAGSSPGKGHNSKSYDVTADELLQFIERVEQLRAEMKDIKEQEKEVFSEMKARGYDTKTARKVITMRQKSADERAEEEALLDTYLAALGMV